jgi:hypothetical protein
MASKANLDQFAERQRYLALKLRQAPIYHWWSARFARALRITLNPPAHSRRGNFSETSGVADGVKADAHKIGVRVHGITLRLPAGSPQVRHL